MDSSKPVDNCSASVSMYFDAESTISSNCTYKTVCDMTGISTMSGADESLLNSILEIPQTVKKVDAAAASFVPVPPSPLGSLLKNIMQEYRPCSTPAKEQSKQRSSVPGNGNGNGFVDLGLAFMDVEDIERSISNVAIVMPTLNEENKENLSGEGGSSMLSVSSSIETVIERKALAISMVEKSTIPEALQMKDGNVENEEQHSLKDMSWKPILKEPEAEAPAAIAVVKTKRSLLKPKNMRKSTCEPDLRTNRPSRISMNTIKCSSAGNNKNHDKKRAKALEEIAQQKEEVATAALNKPKSSANVPKTVPEPVPKSKCEPDLRNNRPSRISMNPKKGVSADILSGKCTTVESEIGANMVKTQNEMLKDNIDIMAATKQDDTKPKQNLVEMNPTLNERENKKQQAGKAKSEMKFITSKVINAKDENSNIAKEIKKETKIEMPNTADEIDKAIVNEIPCSVKCEVAVSNKDEKAKSVVNKIPCIKVSEASEDNVVEAIDNGNSKTEAKHEMANANKNTVTQSVQTETAKFAAPSATAKWGDRVKIGVGIFKNRTSLLPSAQAEKRQSIAFKQRLSTVVKTTLNSPSRKIARLSLIPKGPQTRNQAPSNIKSGSACGMQQSATGAIRKSVLPRSINNVGKTENAAATPANTTKAYSSDKIKPPNANWKTLLPQKNQAKATASNKTTSKQSEFVCPVCATGFRFKSVLDAHSSLHKDDMQPTVRVRSASATTSSATSSATGKSGNQCKYCDKKFALARALHIHLMQNCQKIPPSEKRKLHFTEMDHVEKAKLPVFVKEPERSLLEMKGGDINASSTINELAAAVDGNQQIAMAPPSASVGKTKRKVAHAGIYRTPSKCIPCHSCKKTFMCPVDFTNHTVSMHVGKGNESDTHLKDPSKSA